MTAPGLNLKDILKKKWDQDKLGHFYILENKETPLSNQKLNDWTGELILSFIDNNKPKILETGHPDLLWIQADEETAYSLGHKQFEELFRLNEFKPLELKRRIIVVEKAYLISKSLANKLLKTLEDAQEFCLFIFLNPGNRQLLNTINSRAINLSIIEPSTYIDNSVEKINFADWIKTFESEVDEDVIETVKTTLVSFSQNEQHLSKTVEQLKSSKAAEQLCFDILSKWLVINCESFPQGQQAISALQWWEEQKTFHNSSNSRLENLLSTCFTNIASR